MNGFFKRLAICLSIIGGASSTAGYANSFRQTTIAEVQIDNRACVFFWLNGVNQPEPSVSSDHWIALPKSTPNYQEMVSALFSAKLTNKPIYIYTDATSSCGYATAATLGFEQ